jgi:hypothetical protein
LKNKLGGVVVLLKGKHGAPARRPDGQTPDHYRLQEMRKKKHKNKKNKKREANGAQR